MAKRGSSQRNTILLEPISRITSFDNLGFRTTQAVNGAIAGALFGKDKSKSDIFYKSKASRVNKQILSQMTSEVYSYLNSIISEYANSEDYFFRLWVTVEIDSKSGEIVSEPHFEIDMFKYVGKVGGKYVDSRGYALKVVFIGKEETHLAPIFIKSIKKVASDTKLIDFKLYDSYSASPKTIQKKITPDAPYLIINEEPFDIKLRIDKKTKIIPSIEKDGATYDFVDQSSIENFILREIALKPEIGKSGTFFQLSDDEVRQIKEKIDQNATNIDEPDFLKSLGVDKILTELKEKIDAIDTLKISDDEKASLGKQVRQFERVRDNYSRLASEWEVPFQEIAEMEKDRDKGIVTYEEFSTLRVRRSTALRKARQALIDFQGDVKSKIVPELNEFLKDFVPGKK
jgi:hypothetical protein